MGLIITSGTGQDYALRVDSNHRAHTFSVSEELLENRLREGQAFYVSLGALEYFGGSETGAGTPTASEYVVGELYNNTEHDLMIVSPQMWATAAYTLGPYAEVGDQWFRINQWLYAGALLHTTGNNGIVKNLNRTSTNELDTRPNGNAAMRWTNSTHAVATPGSSDAGYICGFKMKGDLGKVEMMPERQNLIIGRGQSWVISLKPPQNSSPTNLLFGCRAAVVSLEGVV